MSRVLTANDVCCRSLRAISAFPVTESAPDGEQLREAMTWLDMILADVAGTERMFSRIPGTLSIALVNGTSSYDLYVTLGSALPPDRIQFVTDAYAEDSAGNRRPIEIVNREKIENVDKPTQTGAPRWIYIDRLATPTLRTFPTRATTDTTTDILKLVVQQYAPDVAPGGVTGAKPSGSVLHEFGVAWQRWMVAQLAHDLGSGPIHKLPETSLKRFGAMAAESKTRLLARENREQETTPPICDAPGGWLDCDDGDWRTSNHGTDYGNRWP